MIWLTWRQYRIHVAMLSTALLAFTAALLLTGPHLDDAYRQDSGAFLGWVSGQRSDRNLYTWASGAGFIVPALVGAFWAAPMIARELEAGTHRLVWSQSVTRNRWLAVRLGVGMLGAVTASGILGLVLTWWAHPVDKAVEARGGLDYANLFTLPRLQPDLFASRGVAPIGYAAVAFAAGVLAGAVLRRPVPAMGVTLAAYVIVQVVMPTLVRPHLAEPVESTVSIEPDTLHGFTSGPSFSGRPDHVGALDVGGGPAGSWLVASQTVDASGRPVQRLGSWVTDCLPKPGSGQTKAGPEQAACFDRIASEGYRQQLTYHPAGQYWALQWRETGLLLAGATGLVGACFWRVRRLS